jgi:hypothetical protein
LTPEFAEFSRQIKKELRKTKGYEVVAYSRGHFYFSVFLKNTTNGKFVYLSCSDVRYFINEWHNNLLIRTAQHEKDYTGGRNNFTTFDRIK